MSASFKRIDYSLRPAKYAERKMLVEIYRRLVSFQPIEDYSYIGFGSVWFSDFILFHKTLGIRDMVSIEQADTARERFEANKPFKIDMRFASASIVLPELSWDNRKIVWLDYDDPLSPSMLHDVASVARRALSGSILTVSLQCVKAPSYVEAQRDRLTDESAIGAIERFRQVFGREKVPTDASDDDLTGWPYGALCRRMLCAEIENALSDRNTNPNNELRFLPICDIEYQDDARMTTLVGIFVSHEDIGKYDTCRFEKLDFFPVPTKPIRIEMPKLTVRELRLIEQQLPLPVGHDLTFGHIPESDAIKYSKMYRYFPNFAVMEN